MNLKGMEVPIQFRLTLILLPALTLVFLMAPRTGLSACTKVFFEEITSSKCLQDTIRITENTTSANDCALRCILRNQCQYFSYCNGACHMHQSFHDKEIRDFDCNCSSFILLSGNVTDWQKVFEMTPNSFKRSPIYLYWDKLPIEKVEFRLKKASGDKVIIFDGTGTNSISWFQKEKLINHTFSHFLPEKFTFNEKYILSLLNS
ncbi:uncharacterized protein LOC118768101 [Octopus sinensis]|uniref:Uncharacterized protein LOC118768101 n=1 Tax=Octopus sinensis TaxID=2607531 RepID=A0A7E6FQ18_9MOLL|nr:uncharacterized protein LOC118768101 [Octopus sinensis]